MTDGKGYCPICGQEFNSFEQYENHYKYTHFTPPPSRLPLQQDLIQKAKFGKGLFIIILLVIIAIGIGIDRTSTTSTTTAVNDKAPHTDSMGRSIPDTVTNDAELLLYRCGTPSKDDSTEYDNPRPQIPSRTIEYRKAHLRFAFLPPAAVEAILNSGGDRPVLDVLANVRITDPPPYKWKQFGLVDTLTNKAVSAGQLKVTLSKRLPCALANKVSE